MMGMSGSFRVLFDAVNAAVEMVKTFVIKLLAAAVVEDVPLAQESDELIVKDANGNLLADGDSVTIIKDLKVKGSSSMLKIGTKVKNIRLVEGDHNIDCKIDGFGPMKLKSEFVKKN